LEIAGKLNETGRAGDAILLFRASLDQYEGEELAPILFNLAVMLVNSGASKTEAIMLLDRAIKSHPNFIEMYEMKAQIAMQSNRIDDALCVLADGIRMAEKLNHSKKSEQMKSTLRKLLT
jgi:predicted Zn-dependent protease